MYRYLTVLLALALGLGCLAAFSQASRLATEPVTAIDIALEPDATMIHHAEAVNARLLKQFPKGFALDATHHPHISMLQRYVRTSDLDRVYAAAGKILTRETAVAPFTVKTGTAAAASVYHLGNFGTARKQLKGWELKA